MRDVQVLGEKREKNNKNYLLKKQLKQLSRQSTSWRDKENNT